MRRAALGGRKLEKEMSKTEGRFSRNFKNAEIASNHRAHVLSLRILKNTLKTYLKLLDKLTKVEKYGEQTLTKELNR